MVDLVSLYLAASAAAPIVRRLYWWSVLHSPPLSAGRDIRADREELFISQRTEDARVADRFLFTVALGNSGRAGSVFLPPRRGLQVRVSGLTGLFPLAGWELDIPVE